MKEATGELNMTVVTVVAIAAVGAFFYAFVWPGIRNNIQASTYCAMADCNADYSQCTACKNDDCTETWQGSCATYMRKQNEAGTGTNTNP